MLHITFVCTGNICRSPMGDVILNQAVEEAGLADRVRVNSCGMGGWHVGDPADHRAIAELASAGYDGTRHRAAQIGPAHEGADLFVAMDAGHVRQLRSHGIEPEKIRLMRSFDPEAGSNLDCADPYYGTPADFTLARTQVEAAIPGILAWIEENV